jgi:alpha-amylase
VRAIRVGVAKIRVVRGQTVEVPVVARGQGDGEATLTWRSSKPKVASVARGEASGSVVATLGASKTLRVTGVRTGKATITFTSSEGRKARVSVEVVPAPIDVARVSLRGGKQSLKVGASMRVSVKTVPARATGAVPRWTSTHPDVVAVDQTGRVTGVARGTATITATVKGKSVSRIVHVR